MKHGSSRFVLLVGVLAGLLGSGTPAPVRALDLSRLPLPAPHVTPAPPAAGRKDLKIAAAPGADAVAGFAHKKPANSAPAVPTRHLLDGASPGMARFAAIERHGFEGRGDLGYLASDRAVHELAALVDANGTGLTLDWRPETGTPMILQGRDLLPYAVPATTDPTGRARAFLGEYGALLRLDDPAREMEAFRVERGEGGFQAVRFQQKYRGLTVWGRDAIVRLDPAGRVIGFGGHYVPTPRFVATTARVDWTTAQRTLLRTLAARDKRSALLDGKAAAAPAGAGATADAPELVYYPAPGGLRLAWRAVVSDGLDYRREAFVDATTGEFLHDVTLVMNEDVLAHGTDLSNTTREVHAFKINSDFFLINTTKPMFNPAGALPNDGKGIIWLINAQNGDGNQLIHVTSQNKENWGNGNRNAISAAFWANIVFDYYKQRHNRNSIDDKGMNLQLVTNFKTNYNNAFWNGTFMIFGNGDGNTFSDLAGSLDVTGHEMSHGVTEHTANLVYELQSGALNEHFSDAMGVAVDFFANPGTANFLVGEDVTSPATPGDGLRNMQDPHNAFSPQPATMAEFNNLPNNDDNDHGGVHTNSGIPNRAFFLASTAAGMTVAKSERIWYRCLSQYLVRNSQFVDFRIGLTKAAEDLFGAGSAEQTAVVNALDTVGIPQPGGGGSGGGTPPPPPLPDNNGTDFVAAVDSGTGLIFRTHPNGTLDFQQITGVPVGPGGRPTFTDDGALMAWVGEDNNIYGARSDGANPTQLTNDANWWSVALNNNGSLLAATSRFEDGTIFVFDLQNAANNKSFTLENQTSGQGSTGDLVVFADVLEFAAGANFLLYDAKNRTNLNGTAIDYWDINLLRLDNGNTLRVFQPLPLDESIGNPTFAQNSDNKIAFDHVKSDGSFEVIAVDFQSGSAGLVTNNFTSDGRPTFSGNDQEIFYHFRDGVNADQIFRVTLAGDGITGSGNDAVWATEGFWPVWFTIGTARTPVTLVSFTGAWRDDAVRLDWRVADAAGTAGYHVERQVGAGAFERRTAELIPAGGGAEGAYHFDEVAPAGAGAAIYRVMAVERNGAVRELGRLAVDRQGGGVAALRPVLLPASPNPFTAATSVRFVIPARLAGAAGSVTVHDLNGRLVARLLDNAPLEAGPRDLAWDGTGLNGGRAAAGAYFVRLTAGHESLSEKVIVAR